MAKSEAGMLQGADTMEDRLRNGEDGRLYLLPMEDGSTAITFLEEKQTKLVTYPLEPDVEEEGPALRKRILEYATYFPEAYTLKVSLFKEMSRALPTWTEIKDYDWLKDLHQITGSGDLLDPKEELTESEEVLLKWLLFTVNDPKITVIPKRCIESLLERHDSDRKAPLPAVAFLLEHKDGSLQGVSGLGYLSPGPDELFPLLYLFPEAAKGLYFTATPEAALARLTSRQVFSLAGFTASRYRVLLMLEYLLHPGIHCITNGSDEIIAAPVQPAELYKIMETKYIRPVAILLYKVPVVLRTFSFVRWFQHKLKLNSIVIFTLISLCIIGQTLIKTKSLKIIYNFLR